MMTMPFFYNARKVISCNEKTAGLAYAFICFCIKARSTLLVHWCNNNGLHSGTDISEITKRGFVWFC